jgi:IS4 transposase
MTRFFGSHCEFPVARLSLLYDVADGQTLHSLIVPSEVGERDCAHLHLDHVPADSLTLFERGYPGHWLLALFEQQQRHVLESGDSEVLVTSLLDRQAFPVAVFADIYLRRWGIETDYRHLKQTLCLNNFSSRGVTAVKQDFHAGQLLKNLALLMHYLSHRSSSSATKCASCAGR